MYICVCHAITEDKVIKLVEETSGVFIFASIAHVLKEKHSCCKCLPRTKEVINAAIKQKAIKASQDRAISATVSHASCIAGVLKES